MSNLRRLRLTAGRGSRFTSALPRTMELASLVQLLLERHLKTPDEWSFQDRVLVHLEPLFKKDAAKFHSEGGGLRLDRLYGVTLIEKLDEKLFVKLCMQIDRLLAAEKQRIKQRPGAQDS